MLGIINVYYFYHHKKNAKVEVMEKAISFFHSKQTITVKGGIIDLETPRVMGIINVTSDSFFGGSRFNRKYRIYRRAKQILDDGGTIIDVGACSTRPGSDPITQDDELKNLSKAISIIKKKLPNAVISVDTFRSGVAKRMVKDFEINLINDISAGDLDPAMHETIAELNIPYIAMHMKGTPKNMQVNPTYDDVVKEVFRYFTEKVDRLKSHGIKDILIDPGFGFGKTIEHNYTLLKNLDSFRLFDLPLVVGLSRKSMIYKYLGTKPEDALNGTTVLNSIALQKGAKILRVHDVKEAVEAIKLVQITDKQPITE